MIGKLSNSRTSDAARGSTTVRARIVMWAIWTMYVVGFAFVHWSLDLAGGRPAPIVGLVLHTLLAGLFGLIVMTWIEMRLDPERFIGS